MKNLIFLFLSGLALLLINIELLNNVDGFRRWHRRRQGCYPNNCEVSAWSSWSNCSPPCGTDGIQSRTRRVTKEASCRGSCNERLIENRRCNDNEIGCHLQGRPQGDDYCACKAGYTGKCCEMECGADVNGKSGRIHYEGWPGSVVGKCIWQAHTDDNSKVSAKMERCSLQVSSYIEIRDGEDSHAPLLKNITESDCIAGLIHFGYASSNKMWIRLISPAQLEENIYFNLTFHELRVCVATDDKENGEIYPEEDYYLPGDAVTVVCHIGFESSTNYTYVICEEGGSWDAEMPACIMVSCGDPGQVKNGDSEGDDFTYGRNITYHCHEGYVVNGTDTITCQSNGQWSAAAPVCALVTEIGDTSLTTVIVTVSMALFVMVILIVIAAILLYRRSTAANPKTSEMNDLPDVTYELTTAGTNLAEQVKGITSLNNTKSNRRVKTSHCIHTYENASLEVHGNLKRTKCLGNINISESSTDDIYHGIDESDGDLTIGSGFVLNDIYEAGDDKTVDSVMNIKRSGLGHGQNDDPSSESNFQK